VQRLHVGAGEAAAEVARRGRIGNPLGAQQIEIGLVLPPQFEVLERAPRAERVVGQVEHVVALVIRQMHLEQVQPLVDRLSQLEPPHQLLHERQAAIGRAHTAARQLEPHVGALEHRPRPIRRQLVSVQPLLHAALAVGQTLVDNWLHSELLRRGWLHELVHP